VALPAPVISLEGSVLSWEIVNGASGYAVYISGEAEPRSTTDTQINLAILEPGTYTVQVVAKGVSGISLDSPKSNSVSYTKEAGPALPAGFFDLGPLDGNAWYCNGRDGKTTSLLVTTLSGAKYVIMEVVSKVGQDGFGGIQFAMQSSTFDGGAWKDEMVVSGWNKPSSGAGAWDIENGVAETFYIVIELNEISWWAGFVASTTDASLAKLIVNTWPDDHLILVNAYLAATSVTLVKPGIVYDTNVKGWAQQAKPF